MHRSDLDQPANLTVSVTARQPAQRLECVDLAPALIALAIAATCYTHAD